MIKYLIQKEFLQIRRNAFLPRLIIIFPIMIMCVMPWVMNQEVRNIRVSVVDHDHSSLSARLVHSIEQSNYFCFRGMQPSYELARKEIEKSRTDIILVISKGYGKVAEMKAKGNAIPSEEGRGKILIAANAVNGVKGGIGASYLSQIVMASANPDAAALQTAVSTFYLYNKHLNYKLFMIPALLAIVMMLMCSFLPALNIVSEKETGTIEQINVTPVSKWSFILAKLIPYWLMGLLVVTICLLLAWAIYGITCQGPIALVYLLTMVLALFFSSLGLLVSNYSETLQQAILVIWFFMVCLLLLSGLFTPTRSMPHWAHHLHQSHALFHRCHPYSLCSWRQFRCHRPSSVCSLCLCHPHELLGCGKLQEELLRIFNC